MSDTKETLSINMEKVCCNLCGSIDNNLFLSLKDWAYETEGNFSLVRCECGLVYLNPRPTFQSIDKYYPKSYKPYYQVKHPKSRFHQILYYWKWRARSLQVLKVCKQGRILDVGCSSGLFLQSLRRYGQWDTYGVEINPVMADVARGAGISVVEGEIFDAEYPSNYFDVITLWDVLEHVHNPKANLNEIFRILKPNGVLFVSTPNLRSLDAKIFKQFWIGYDTPRHLYVYDVDTLSRYLNITGFKVERIYSFYGRYTTFALSLNSLLKQYIRRQQVRQKLKKFLFFPFWRQITLPYFWLVDMWGLGAIITVRARRIS